MLIDDFMSDWDFTETHDIKIRATAESVFRALYEVDFCESATVRWLFRLRGLPTENMTLRELRKLQFQTLGESANQEFLLGLAGRFWTLTGNMQNINSNNFREFNKKGYAKAAWNFSLDEATGETHLITETRIKCTDSESRRSFGFYWTFVQPFSGLVRKEMLRLIKKKAEDAGFQEI